MTGIGVQSGQQATPRTRVSRVVVFLTAFVACQSIATQLAAANLNYHSALGINFRGFYLPHYWGLWLFRFPELLVVKVSAGVAIVSTAIFLLALALSKSRRQKDGNATLHGTASFATEFDICRMGLLNESDEGTSSHGVYLGAWEDKKGRTHYLQHDGPEHIILYAPTRSGKGISTVLPTLLSWRESVVVTDIKGELFALTSGWRQTAANNCILKLDLVSTNEKRTHFNPLCEIRLGKEHEQKDAYNQALMIVDAHGHGLTTHWDKTGYLFIAGVILHCLYKWKNESKPTPSLAQVASFLSQPNRTFDQSLDEMLGYRHTKDGTHQFIAEAARSMLDKPSEERGSVKSTVEAVLAPYKESILAAVSSKSDFRISDLLNHEQPVSLYIIIPPSDLNRLIPFVRMLIDLVATRSMENMEFENGRSVRSYKHRLLLLLDEFPAFGKLSIFEKGLAYMAGYGLKACIICQDKMQLNAEYGENESITANCHVRVVFAPNEVKTAEWISKMLGSQTVLNENYSISGKRTAIALDSMSSSIQEVQRSLLTTDEVMRIPGALKDSKGNVTAPGDLLIFVSGHPPVYGKQILYFKDPAFAARSRVPAAASTDVIRLQRGAELDPVIDSTAKSKTTQRAVAVLGVFLPIILISAADNLGIYLNLTPSFPIGLYRAVSSFEPARDKGELVKVNLPDTSYFRLAQLDGYVQSGITSQFVPLLKRVVGVEGDQITIEQNSVWANGKILQNSTIYKRDRKGRLLAAAGGGVVPARHVWLHGENSAASYDSRYFGSLPVETVESVLKPLWVFG
jgi:type IV secretion system protein VirD4